MHFAEISGTILLSDKRPIKVSCSLLHTILEAALIGASISCASDFAMIKWKTFAIGCSLALALLLFAQRKPSMPEPNRLSHGHRPDPQPERPLAQLGRQGAVAVPGQGTGQHRARRILLAHLHHPGALRHPSRRARPFRQGHVDGGPDSGGATGAAAGSARRSQQGEEAIPTTKSACRTSPTGKARTARFPPARW